MRRLFEDNEKKLSTTWYIVIYTIQTITILSQQNKRHWNLFKQYIIFKKRFTVTVVSDLRKVISKQTPPLYKRRIRNAENLVDAAAFNRIKTVCPWGKNSEKNYSLCGAGTRSNLLNRETKKGELPRLTSCHPLT